MSRRHPAFYRKQELSRRAAIERSAHADVAQSEGYLDYLPETSGAVIGYGRVAAPYTIRCVACGDAFPAVSERHYPLTQASLAGRDLRCAICQAPLTPPERTQP